MNSSNSKGAQNSHWKRRMQDPDESITGHIGTPHRMSANRKLVILHIFLLNNIIEAR